MSDFDPRREPIRFAPAIATLALTVCAGALIAGSRAEAVTTGKLKAPAAKVEKADGAKADRAKADKSKTKPSAEKPDPVKVAAKKGVAEKPSKAVQDRAPQNGAPKDGSPKDGSPKDGSPKDGPKTEPGYGEPQLIKVKLRKGETLEAAVRRAEASADDAEAAAKLVEATLGAAPKAGQVFQLEVAPRDGRVGSGRVHKLTIPAGADGRPLVLLRTAAGKLAPEKTAPLKTAKLDLKTKNVAPKAADKTQGPSKDAKAKAPQVKNAKVKDARPEVQADEGPMELERVKLVSGEVRGSLYGSARKAGVGGGQIGEIVKVFAAKLDFERDLKAGDRFKVVYDDDGKLLFAQIKGVRFHRFARRDGEAMWLDEEGRSLKGGLLRTPVDGARMSSLFGMRRHPILGYAKMHQGIDFAAASGTPIMAAGDGEVVEVRRWGGYGNWLRIRHAGGYESGYAHLSRYASGLSVGDKVRQGQLVAYVGSTGASTGPHLHHEIWLHGKRVDPKGAKIPAAQVLEGTELVAFQAQRKRVDAVLGSESKLAAKKNKAKVAALRPKQNAA